MDGVSLALGVVSLAALLETCVKIIRYVDCGKKCSVEQQECQMLLKLQGTRLENLERRFQTQLSAKNEQLAADCLKQIYKRLEEVQKLQQKYTSSRSTSYDELALPTAGANFLTIRHAQSRKASPPKRASRSISFGRRVRWALVDCEEMKKAVLIIRTLVSDLESHFEASQMDRRTEELTGTDSLSTSSLSIATKRLLLPSEQDDSSTKVIHETSMEPIRHIYSNIIVAERGIVHTGDHYSEKWTGAMGQGGRNTYDGIQAMGDSRVHIGTMYGGKDIFDR